MTTKRRYLAQSSGSLRGSVESSCPTTFRDSVYFYTFHKCASTLFAGYVLKNIDNLRHVDYARQIYHGEPLERLDFRSRGFVYGPIRLSVDPRSPVYERLVRPLSSNDFVRNKTAIFLVRDPRDILVSAYYSFGYTHGFSKVGAIAEIERSTRNEIRSKTIDEYALDSAHGILGNFQTLLGLSAACGRGVVLRYEDMIDDWDVFVAGLTKYVRFRPTSLREIYERSRPQEKERTDRHRRSGVTGGFRTKLADVTVASLNDTLHSILERLGYDA